MFGPSSRYPFRQKKREGLIHLPKTNLRNINDPAKRKLSKIHDDLKKNIDVIVAGPKETTSAQPKGEEASSSKEKAEAPPQSSLPVAAPEVFGFDDDVISLEKVLLRQGSEYVFKAIGIIGMAGIGKTALSQSLFNEEEVKEYFLPRIWVSMRQPGDDGDIKASIVKRMLLSLGVEKDNINEVYKDNKLKGLLYALHVQLQGKRYLIVFDDARETDEGYGQLNSSSTRDGKWDALSYGLPKGCGGAVIVTSRDQEIARKMIGEKGILHGVQPLSDPEKCWSIFKDGDEEYVRHLDVSIKQEILKQEILRKCAGLPLTAKMMGELKDKYIPEN